MHIGRKVFVQACGLSPKHTIKQVDRLFSNELLSTMIWSRTGLNLLPKSHRSRGRTGLDGFAKSDRSTLWFCP